MERQWPALVDAKLPLPRKMERNGLATATAGGRAGQASGATLAPCIHPHPPQTQVWAAVARYVPAYFIYGLIPGLRVRASLCRRGRSHGDFSLLRGPAGLLVV